MATHGPDLSNLSISQLHRLTGRDRRTITKALEGLEPEHRTGKAKLYNAPAALERIYLGAGLNFTAERARLAKEQADAQELKNAQTRGDLIPAEEIEARDVALLSAVRTRLLAVPSKAAPLAHAAETIGEVEAILREHQTEALQELADAKIRDRTSA